MKALVEVSFLISSDYYGGSRLEITDSLSGIRFVDVKIPDKELALMLGRMVNVKCEADIRGLEYVGKKVEHKTAIIDMPKNAGYGDERKKIAFALGKGEAARMGNGWMICDMFDSKDSFKNDAVKAHFRRYVDVDILKEGK